MVLPQFAHRCRLDSLRRTQGRHTPAAQQRRGTKWTFIYTKVAGLLVLFTVAGCSLGQSSHATFPGSSPTAGQPNATESAVGTNATTPGVTATVTPGVVAFQANFTEQYTVATCSGSHPAGTICVVTTGNGQGYSQAQSLGTVQLTRTSLYAPGGSDSCGAATTTGTLIVGTGEKITFRGTGTFCRATQTANFAYTITGGTGAYMKAGGTGTILVPLPTSSSTGTETWKGMLRP